MATRFVLAAGVLLLLTGQGAPASAQNLLTNPNFDSSLIGWQTGPVPGITVAWDGTLDADGSSSSGSVLGSFSALQFIGLVPVVSQCVATTPGTTYLLGGEIFIPSGQDAFGSAFVSVLFYPSANCSGPPPPAPSVFTPQVFALDSWSVTAATATAFGPSAVVSAYLDQSTFGTFRANFDNLILRPAAGACVPSATTLCLNRWRFKVTATFDTGDGDVRSAHVVPAPDGGSLWFFSSGNVESIVKVINGCGLGGHYWFFAAGLTNVKVVLTVTDTQTGAVRTYTNPLGTPFVPIQDTAAFPCT
jgi:hypothetical protein